MKKVIMTLVLFMSIFVFSSCATQNVNSNKISNDNNSANSSDLTNLSNSSNNIKFQYFYRGFATIRDNMVNTYPHDAFVIQTDEDWHDIMNKYVPGIPYNTPIDFSKECLIFIPFLSAKPIYASGVDIKAFILDGNTLELEYVSGPNGVSNEIYAQNVDDLRHVFVNIVKIKKEDIPKNIENIYIK